MPHSTYLPEKMGSATVSPTGRFEAGSYQEFTVTYTAGYFGIDDTGSIKVAHRFASDMGRPQFDNPEAPNYTTVEASNGAILHVEYDMKRNIRPWDKTLYIKVVRGFLRENDEIVIRFGDRRDGSQSRDRRGQGPRGGQGQRGSTPQRRRGDGPPKGLGGDQVEGRQAVRELLLAGTRRTREVVLAGDLDPAPILDDIIDLADEQKVTIREVARSKFESLVRTEAPQGVVAFADALEDHGLEALLATSGPASRPPFLLLLDGVTDPGNLGAILRSAECAGVTGVVLPRHRAVRVTAMAAKSAAGAIEHLRLATVTGLPKAMARLSQVGIWSVGLDAGGSEPIHDLTVADGPVALVMGAEGAGLSRLVRERCDTLVHVPLRGVLASMNVSAAAAVALFEVARRRDAGA